MRKSKQPVFTEITEDEGDEVVELEAVEATPVVVMLHIYHPLEQAQYKVEELEFINAWRNRGIPSSLPPGGIVYDMRMSQDEAVRMADSILAGETGFKLGFPLDVAKQVEAANPPDVNYLINK